MTRRTHRMMARPRAIVGLSLLVAVSACASAPPPRELLDAREAYKRAAAGPAADLVPDKLFDARKALDAANKSCDDDCGSDTTRDLAYIAQRNAMKVEALAGAVKATKEREKAQREIEELRNVVQSRTESQLATTREQLQKERQARELAEAQAREAAEKLAHMEGVTQETRGLVITLNGAVLFGSGQSTLSSEGQNKLAAVADALKAQQSNRNIIVEGHSDSAGSSAVNDDVSLARAEVVRDYLVARGIPPERIRATGMGSTRPVGDNRSAQGRARNRRVEIILQPASPR